MLYNINDQQLLQVWSAIRCFCSDPVGSPGALPIVRYLDSLGDELKPNCDSGYYYMLNDTNPGFLPNGQLGLGTGGFLLVDADDLEAATLGKGAQITFLPIA